MDLVLGLPTQEAADAEDERYPVLPLVADLCGRLDADGIDYCHWKSNEALHRSAAADNDLDLLVAQRDLTRFTAVLAGLGFKEARLPAKRELPGVLHFYGLDEPSGRIVHVHVQYALVLGDDTTKNVRLPVEDVYLASARQGRVFRVPSPEVECVVLVVRMVLKHATWDALAYGRGRLSASERREYAWLRERVDAGELARVRDALLPFVSDRLWDACVRTLDPHSSARQRARTGLALHRALRPHARRPWAADAVLRVWRRGAWGAKRYALRIRTKKRMVGGGALVAIVGGDGSGKSSAVTDLHSWLSGTFPARRVHLGKPRRSLLTLAVKGPMLVARKAGLFRATRLPAWEHPEGDPTRFPGYAWMLWHVLNARDRRRQYTRARRYASNGGIVVCDRFPLPQLRFMDGVRTAGAPGLGRAGRLAWWLAERERRAYLQVLRPDVLVVLRVDPGEAVRRRTDEDSVFVRRRAEEVWDADWQGVDALVVDAGQPQDRVRAQVRAYVWSRL